MFEKIKNFIKKIGIFGSMRYETFVIIVAVVSFIENFFELVLYYSGPCIGIGFINSLYEMYNGMLPYEKAAADLIIKIAFPAGILRLIAAVHLIISVKTVS